MISRARKPAVPIYPEGAFTPLRYRVERVVSGATRAQKEEYVDAVLDTREAAEQFAAARSFFAECWGTVIRYEGSDRWLLVYKGGRVNDSNVDPILGECPLVVYGSR